MAISMAIGTSLSGIIYNKLGFYGAYGISSILLVIGLSYGILFVNDVDPVSKLDKKKSFCTTVSEFFDLSHVSQLLSSFFKKRPDTQRLRLIILLFILMTNSGTNNGYRTVSYLYTRVQFNWNELKYSVFATYELLLNIVGLLFVVFILSKKFKIPNEIIGMLSTISQSMAALFYFFAYNAFLFYIGPLVGILVTSENISIKSLMIELVPSSELSQVGAIFGIAEIIISLVFGLMYNGLYEATMNTLPGAFFIITFVFTFPSIALFYWMYMKRRQDREDSKRVLKCPQTNFKTLDQSNYGTIVIKS